MSKEIARIANELSEAERRALMPFAFFSDAIGSGLGAKGLLANDGGVWTHTKRGIEVRREIERRAS